MALFTTSTSKRNRALTLALLGLLSIAILVACSSEPEPTALPQTATANTVDAASPSMAPTQQPAVLPGPAPAPQVSPQPAASQPEPTRAPVATPLVVVPPATLASPSTSVDGAADENNPASGNGTSSPPFAELPAIGPDATWGDVFSTFTEEEQSCIRNELGEERLNQILEHPIAQAGLESEPITVLSCISDDAAREILLATMAAQFGGLNDEQEVCLQELLGNFSPVDLAQAMEAPEPTPEAALMMLSFGLGMVACVPELAQEGGPGGPLEGAGPVDGTVQDESLLWSFTTGGWVLTAPAVVDGVVYAGSDDHSMYALAADSGELIGSFATGDVIRSTPTIVDGMVYFGSNDNHLYAVDAATGQQLWQYDTGEWVQYSPAVGGGRVYFGAPAGGDRRVHAVDAATGEAAWIAEHPFPIGANHTPTHIGSKVYAQGAEYGEFYALDAATGETAWQAEVGGYVESAPTVIDGVVYLTVINQAYAFNESTGAVIWEFNTEEFPARDFPALVVDGIYYLAPSDKVYALDAATGAELWSYQAGEISTKPVVDEGVVYGASSDGGTVFALDAATGQEIWKESTGGQVIQSLTATDGLLFGESDSGTLIAAAGDSGVPVWTFEKGGFSDVRGYTVVDGVVYSAGPNNSVYAHRAP